MLLILLIISVFVIDILSWIGFWIEKIWLRFEIGFSWLNFSLNVFCEIS